jgi:hypothetical protein
MPKNANIRITINQVCHVIFEKKDPVSDALDASALAIDETDEKEGKSSGFISDNVLTNRFDVLIIIKKYIKFYYYKFIKYHLFLYIFPIDQDINVCCPKILKINEIDNPDLHKFIIEFIIVYPVI